MNKIENTIKKLSYHFWSSVILSILIITIAFFWNPLDHPVSKFLTTTAEMYTIGITLLALPLSLWQYARRINELGSSDTSVNVILEYKKAFYYRLYTLDAIVFINCLFFAVSRNTNYFWLALVTIVIFMFCRPSYAELEGLFNKKNDLNDE